MAACSPRTEAFAKRSSTPAGRAPELKGMPEDHREILGVDLSSTENGSGWVAFLRSPVARGLSGVQLVVSDAHGGLVDAIGAALPGARPDGPGGRRTRREIPEGRRTPRERPRGPSRLRALPSGAWRQIWSNNPRERLNKEIRRHPDVVGNFPDRDAIIRLVGAVPAEQSDEWTEQRRHIGAEILERCRKTGNARTIEGNQDTATSLVPLAA